MGHENDPYGDEDGEPLMDFDHDINSNNAEQALDRHLLDDEMDDGKGLRRDRSPAPVVRKRLVKKSADLDSRSLKFHLRDEDDEGNHKGVSLEDDVDVLGVYLKDESDGSGKRKKEKVIKLGYALGNPAEKIRDRKEMWETVAGGDSEDDKEGVKTVDDDYARERDHYAPQAEEDEEIKQLFKGGRKKKKHGKSAGQIAILVENVMAELEVVAEEDAELNRLDKPAINKLKKLPLLVEVLSKKQLQQEFLDHGVLTLLKTWLEPLPDGSLPNINIQAAILKILADYPIDLERNDRREQLKKSNLGKVIMFLSKSDEETTTNRKLAKDLVDKWSRPIFNKSARFEDMRNFEAEKSATFKRPIVRKPMSRDAGKDSQEDDIYLAENSKRCKSGQSSDRRLHASRPEALAMDFVVRPQSKIDPEQARARAKQAGHDQRHLKMNKKLQQLKTTKKKQLQATRLSIEGRGMVKYL